MEKKIEEVRSVKVGRYVIIEDEPCRVVGVTHSKPGKHGGAKAKIDAIGIFDDQKRSVIKPTGQKIEVPVIAKKTAQVLTKVGDNVQLMDMGTYETFELPVSAEVRDSLSEGVEVLYMEAMGKRKIIQKTE